jgi:hypothetical protein
VAEGGRNGGRDGERERSVKPWEDKEAAAVQTQSAWWASPFARGSAAFIRGILDGGVQIRRPTMHHPHK